MQLEATAKQLWNNLAKENKLDCRFPLSQVSYRNISNLADGRKPYSGWAFLGLVMDDGGRGGQKALPLPKICHTYPTMRKLDTVIPYLKKIQSKKYMNHMTHFLSSADIRIFSSKISKLCYIKKYRYRLHFDT